MSGRIWTAEENAFIMDRLDQMVYNKTVRRMASRLNRSEPEIRKQVYKLIHLDKHWNEEEIEYLRSNWTAKSALEIGLFLGRSKNNVRYKVRKLRLKGGPKRASLQNAKKQSKSPNKPEIALDKLLQANFPGEYIFNGDYSQGVSLGGLVPDWVNVNGKKQVIELFGDYWHDMRGNIGWKSTVFGRKAVFSQLGFDCLIIWEHELKLPEEVIEKIRDFQ